jgi:hypothetical protein
VLAGAVSVACKGFALSSTTFVGGLDTGLAILGLRGAGETSLLSFTYTSVMSKNLTMKFTKVWQQETGIKK